MMSACTAGPEFSRPTLPGAATPLRTTPVVTTEVDVPGGDSQVTAVGTEVAARWWELYHSEALASLVAEAIRGNPDLAAARQSLVRADEVSRAAGAARSPSVSAGLSQERDRYAQAQDGDHGAPSYYAISEAKLRAVYDVDIWGRLRRSAEAAGADADYARFELEAAYLSLTTRVVESAFDLSALDSEISVQREAVALDARWLDLVSGQLTLGAETELDVELQRSALAQARLSLEGLLAERERARNELAALAGKSPSASSEAGIDLSSFVLPHQLPMSLPAQLIEQRPDVRAAEALFHAETARVGVAVAARLPDVTLSASVGGASLSGDRLFGSGNGFWSLAGSTTQTIFDAGALRHQQRAQESAMREAQEHWRGVVIDSLRDVADALVAVDHDAVSLKYAADDEQAANQGRRLLERQYAIGSASILKVLIVERSWQTAELGLIRARVNRFVDTVQLYGALGGGWWARDDVTADERSGATHGRMDSTMANESQ
jgi:NodT family efflux transporter outer membrane factor (OMF) lipoprotein